MTQALSDKKCKPCEGGVAPLGNTVIKEYLQELDKDWQFDSEKQRISRAFAFPSFAQTIAFANAVAWVATDEGHHPEMIINYGSCIVHYRTTAIDGLSDNDFICAAKIDRLL